MTKVIHVQLLQGRKNYYFGSIPAIYSVLTAEKIGIKQVSLERVGLSKGGVVLNKKAHISAGELIRSKTTKKGSVLKPSCKSILLSTQFHKYLLPLHHEESPIITLHLSRCTCRLL